MTFVVWQSRIENFFNKGMGLQVPGNGIGILVLSPMRRPTSSCLLKEGRRTWGQGCAVYFPDRGKSAVSESFFPETTLPRASACPPRNLVAECRTRSAPNSKRILIDRCGKCIVDYHYCPDLFSGRYQTFQINYLNGWICLCLQVKQVTPLGYFLFNSFMICGVTEDYVTLIPGKNSIKILLVPP